jgi:outer membrane autotransporter protein
VSDVTFWSQGVGAWGRFDGDGNAAGVRRDLGGFFAGVDARFGDFARIGFASGYTHSSVNVDDRASSAGINTFHLGGYGGTQVGPVNLRAGGAYAFHTINTDRAIVFPGLIDAAHASYDASTAQAFGEIGYGLALGRFAVEPFGGLAYVRVQTDGFLENGGIAALAGAGNSNEVVYSSLGVRAATSIPLANGTALIPRATLAWQHAFGDVTPAASLALAAGGVGYAINGVPIARDAALVEAGLDLRVLPQLKVGLSYAGELAGNAQDHAVKGNLTWNF